MMDICGTSISFLHLVLLENKPKAAKVEEETWWRVYWTDAEVEKAKIHQQRSNRMVDPYDSYTHSMYELYAKLNNNHHMCDMAASFDRGPYYQC